MTTCCLVGRFVNIPELQENLVYPIAGQKNTLKTEEEDSLEMTVGPPIYQATRVTYQEQIHGRLQHNINSTELVSV
jgi:hypothetical protein